MSKPRTRIKAISAKALSSKGYSVCLFPEQPKRQIIEEQDEEVQKSVVKQVEAAKPSLELVRLYWRNRLIYLLAFISFSLSLHNVYNFPMNIYRYGEKFFVPYTIVTLLIGFPMHLLQTSMGQYSQRGSLCVWECAPLAFGVGFAMIVACIMVSLYHNIFAAYSLIYFAHCFNRVLPWTYCRDVAGNESNPCIPPTWHISENVTLPAKDYFYSTVLNTQYRFSSDVWALGSFNWWLFLSFLFTWVFIYVATLRSCRSIGKIAIIIVIFSYFAIITLLIVAFQIKGGGKLHLREQEHVGVFSIEMWCAAILQVLLELGICFGIPVVYGSYCRFRNFLYVDSFILCLINYLNSLIFFYLFFSFMRSVSCPGHDIPWGLPDETVGVIHMIYSEAFASLSGQNVWCILFFFMLFLIIAGTQVAVVEALMAALYDNFPHLCERRWYLNLGICVVLFIFGLFCWFSNGYFGALLLYYIPVLFPILALSLLFLVGIAFVYGLSLYSQNMKTMLHHNVSVLVKLCIYILVIALFLVAIITLFLINTSLFTLGVDHGKTYVIVACVLCGVILLPIVICGILWLIQSRRAKVKVLKQSNTWKMWEEEKILAKGQYTTNYSPSYTWEWNKY